MKLRKLKIEPHSETSYTAAPPKIRLKGHWLKQAGFTVGRFVEVVTVAPGCLQLREVAS